MFTRSALAWVLLSSSLAFAAPAKTDEGGPIDLQWGVKIPLRDGVKLNATLYRPHDQKEPLPCILTLTPYVAQRFHDLGTYFAAHGYVFAGVDSRGRGNSEGEFTPLLQEAKDGPDIVEWLAKQSYCNGKITMWGGSYGGYDQWATAKERPPHLATIVPVASPKPGVEFPPNTGGVNWVYDMMWITTTSGHTAQDDFFSDMGLWSAKAREWFDGHRPFKQLDAIVGSPSPIFQTWAAHPLHDPYWDQYVPTAQQYAAIDLPILTITGQYDGDQPGALSFYHEHMAHASTEARAKHYLVIGPWDHFGTRKPTLDYAGLKFGPASLVDVKKLHKDWYDWTLKGGTRPDFLKNKVAYYVLGDGAEDWRYADTLEAVTAESQTMYLGSEGGRADDVLASGHLAADKPSGGGQPDRYVYDPLDTQFAAWDGMMDFANGMTNQSGLLAAGGKILVYHTAPFVQDTELAGFPKFSAWIAMDRPDTDFAVFLYEIRPDGSSILLGMDALRARYRKSRREPDLVKSGAIERYDFNGLPFIARRIGKGSRLRLAFGPMNSKWFEKNYNTGGVVAEESGKDARTVTVTLYHDAAHPSALYLPIAASASAPIDKSR